MPHEPPTTTLTYTIASSSNHSGRYVPENIMVDSPTDHHSRWSAAHHLVPNVKQWILLKLDEVSVVKSVTFGKLHEAPHPCNMKEFRLYIGTSPDHMIEIIHSTLQNNTSPETFTVKHMNNQGITYPARYVKIVPVSGHRPNFHTSIWYVSMSGIADPAYVSSVVAKYEESRETKILTHILKHLRQRRLLTPFASILTRSFPFTLEHPLITTLHTSLVLNGDFTASETLLRSIAGEGLFSEYLRNCQPHAVWNQLHGVDADGDAPSKRGGHAMCIDPCSSTIYLLGGWDGQKSLADFWSYNIDEDRWKVLSHNTGDEKNGPGERSCHKMVFCDKTGCVYLLGRLEDGDGVQEGEGEERGKTVAYCSEFYRYHTRGLDAGKWDLLSFDTASAGGPPLIFDHQMVIDSQSQIIYVFGGRVVDGDWETIKYAGLYSYNIRSSKWRILQPTDSPGLSSQTYIPPRFGHSMVLDSPTHTLYIFAGQREKHYLSDMYSYNLRTNIATELYMDFTSEGGGPDACFTQRAVCDAESKEIYIFCGLTKATRPSAYTVLQSEAPNWVFRYDTKPGTWRKILPNRPATAGMETEEPQPRYAHQVVYDTGRKVAFLHGGNAGIGVGCRRSAAERVNRDEAGTEDEDVNMGGDEEETVRDEKEKDEEEAEKESRLDDFWCVALKRPAPEEIVRRATYQIRRQQFREMCESLPAVKALNFLKTEVFNVVNHDDPEEAAIFRSLLALLLAPSGMVTEQSSKPQIFLARTLMKREASSGTDSSGGTSDEAWTNALDEDEVMRELAPSASPPHSASTRSISERTLRSVPDPSEKDNASKELSAERFRQRTEVFEAILDFINDEWKQPNGSLLDMIDWNEGEV